MHSSEYYLYYVFERAKHCKIYFFFNFLALLVLVYAYCYYSIKIGLVLMLPLMFGHAYACLQCHTGRSLFITTIIILD